MTEQKTFQCVWCKAVKPEGDYVVVGGAAMVSICSACRSLPKPPEMVKAVRGKNSDFATTGTQVCSICKQTLKLEEFPKDKNRKTGRYPRCRCCVSILYKSKHPGARP